MDAAPADERRILCLAGATATGKSAVALCLAEQFGGEIVSVDSMQVYRGLDVGTAKPSVTERQRVTHHLIDVVDLRESFDAAQFARLAQAAVADIRARGKMPILCGGTGLYFRSFCEGLGTAPPASPGLRAELDATPLPVLLEELERTDPKTFAAIDQRNRRRVVRAVEVIRLTGKPFSEQRAEWSGASADISRQRFFGVVRSTDDLRARIDTRVDLMFKNGLVEEVRELLKQGLAENRTATQAIGYRQVIEHLKGERPLAETIELVKVRTRQFAKRQMTWFRRQPQIEWFELAPEESADAVAGRMMERLLVVGRKSAAKAVFRNDAGQ